MRPGLSPRRLEERRARERADIQATPARHSAPTVPGPADISTMGVDEILAELDRFGLTPDFGSFEDALLREARELGRLPAGELSEAARARVGDSIDRAFRTAAAQATKGLVRDYRMAAQIAAGAQGDWLGVCIAVGDAGTCDDCDQLHGEERTLDEWRGRDAPGGASRRCRSNCRCEIVPIRPEGASAEAEMAQAAE